jgi:tryptophan-rich sensory protein
MLSGYGIQTGDFSWYKGLLKPSFNPPNWIFGPVWTLLYLMMGALFGKLWKEREAHKGLLLLFTLQFIFNLAWSPLFFSCHRIDLALYDMSLLWITLVLFMGLTWRKPSFLLLSVPYALWVSFAFILNISIYKMNMPSLG